MKAKPAIDHALKQQIRELIKSKGGGNNEQEVADIIENALKLLTDVQDTGDARIIRTAVRELRYAFRLFAPYLGKRKVTIFGSARTQPDALEYQQAVEFGRKIVKAGFMVITGAGSGIMQAGHEGAGSQNSFGVNIRLPWEQSANPIIAEDKKLVTFKYFFTRKLIFIRHSDAIVLFPGGFGTFDEGFEALTLMQTGKSQLLPLVLVDKPGGTYWKTWDIHIREELLSHKLISPEDLNLYQITDSVDEAVKIILAGDSTGAKTEKDQKRMMTEISKLLGAADGKLDVKDYDRTVAELMAGGSDPVITKKPEGAYSFAVYDAMK